MKIVIRKKMSTCEDLDEQSRSKLFSRPSGEVPEVPPQRKRRAPGTATSDRVASSVKLSDLEQAIDGLATDIVDKIGPAIRSIRSAQLKTDRYLYPNAKRQQQFNQLVSRELEDIAGQIEAIKDSPRLPELDSLPPLDIELLDDLGSGYVGTPPSRPPARSTTQATQARINEIRIRIEKNKN